MKPHPLSRVLAILLTITLIAPSAFFATPQRAHAIFGVGDTVIVVGDISVQTLWDMATQAMTEINTYLTEINTWVIKVATVAQYVNTFVLQPIAFIKSGQLMKMMTAGVLAFVNGQANGTGVPQFVGNLQGNLQRIGDIQATSFFSQYGRNSNSPFATSIIAGLRQNYLQQTSMAGFWAANRNTLPQYSQNPNAYLAGNWLEGGVAAWFALTTQPQNNPYTLYQASQSKLASVIGPGAGGVTGARLATLGWGQGFLSWCGPTAQTEQTDPGYIEPPQTDPGYIASEQSASMNPGDPCTNADGTPGNIKTPGSVITASLNKVLGGAQDKLNLIGDMGAQINQLFGNLAYIMGTINMAKDVLGGPNNTGLAGAGSSPAFQGTSAADEAAVYTSNTADTSQIFSPSNDPSNNAPNRPAPPGTGGTTNNTPFSISPTAVINASCTNATFQFQGQGGTPPYFAATSGGVIAPDIVAASGDAVTLTGLTTGGSMVTISLSDSSSPMKIVTATITCN